MAVSTHENRPRPSTPDNIVTVETDASDADSAQPPGQLPPLLPDLGLARDQRRREQGLRPRLLDPNHLRSNLTMDSAGFMVNPNQPTSDSVTSSPEHQRASRPRPKKFAYSPRRF